MSASAAVTRQLVAAICQPRALSGRTGHDGPSVTKEPFSRVFGTARSGKRQAISQAVCDAHRWEADAPRLPTSGSA